MTDLLATLGAKECVQWLNGSFVTLKANPGDIDFLTLIDIGQHDRLGDRLAAFRSPFVRKLYGPEIDAYMIIVYPEDHPDVRFFRSDKVEWIHKWSDSKVFDSKGRKLNKGYLEIVVDLDILVQLNNELSKEI